ncbi:MuF-C-terminal domain-containing protein [Pseudomonas syringae group genomosp. 3]|uniref:MuF-C-terminal domain-containing protein n=1 Tax=Pseudomonas syringae group genomosp. 3 TaxID=251701 RepID=UPI000EFEAFF2|nr:hypothetical protein [Pseudomonas syringae group genomosp. 3]RMR31202.1 hypothetical protein ALP87_00953 [Pseudomonas syringae pv. coriandricola]
MAGESDSNNFKTLVGIVIQAEISGLALHERILELGPTPQFIIDLGIGFEQLDLILKAKNVGKMVFDHGMKQGVIERMPDLIVSPKAIYRSDSPNPSLAKSAVVMTYETHNGSPIIVPIHSAKMVGRRKVNEVASMYGKEGPDPEVKWKKAGLLLWEA